jgi:hypothetical protein
MKIENVKSNHIITSDINQMHEILVIVKQINLFMKFHFCARYVPRQIFHIPFVALRNPFLFNFPEKVICYIFKFSGSAKSRRTTLKSDPPLGVDTKTELSKLYDIQNLRRMTGFKVHASR